MQGYLPDPAVCFVSTADYTDGVPLGVTEFAQGSDLDTQLSYLGLGGGRGSDYAHEAYELAAWFFVNRVRCPNAKTKPILIFTADEHLNKQVQAKHINAICGGGENEAVGTDELFKQLRSKYEVFLIKKKYHDELLESRICEQWASLIGGERVLFCEEPKAAADLMLGAISLAAGSRNMAGYMDDMVGRGQDDHRQKTVHAALEKYAIAVQANKEAEAAATEPVDSAEAMEMELLEAKAKVARLKAEADPSSQQLAMAAELAEAKLEIAQLRGSGGSPAEESEAVVELQPWQYLGRIPSMEEALIDDLERIALEESQRPPAPAPAPAVYHSS